ncbi:hypothetical protein CDAR_251431 [Caerostris darwini]|uniref:Uncharacterized protein n=1 Tax=Caerostris darwini TaxID=1538125 RepID=A0AAV4UY22_9ARAC|nr:hypothetical protein CDAR_251431 [Caerostris darwini]
MGGNIKLQDRQETVPPDKRRCGLSLSAPRSYFGRGHQISVRGSFLIPPLPRSLLVAAVDGIWQVEQKKTRTFADCPGILLLVGAV